VLIKIPIVMSKKVKKAAAPVAEKKTVKLVISKVNTKINSNNQLSVKTEEGHVINPLGLFQYSEKHLDNLADGCGATDADMLRNAINAGLDDSYLVMQTQQVEVGELVLDNKGATIDDPTTNSGFKEFTKPHIRIINTEIKLGDDAVDYIAEINAKVDTQITMNKRLNRRRNNKKAPVVDATTNVADEDLD